MGAGSVGTIMGAYLSKAGERVELIDVNQKHVQKLNERGATIVGTLNEKIPITALTPEEMTGTYDLILLLTKQGANEQVLHHLNPYLREDSIILSLQNGVPEESLANILGEERVIGGSVEFGATWVEPGVSELTTAASSFKKNAFQIGELDGSLTERVQQVQKVLNHIGHTVISDNLIGTKWSKLLVNVAMSGMSAALGCTYGDIIKNETALESAVMLADETLKTGTAAGVEFTELAGVHVGVFAVDEDQSNLSQVMEITKQAFTPQSRLKASMLQDLEKGRKTEIDYINGFISAKGKDIGVNTPYNDTVVQLIHDAENHKRVPRFEKNIEAFNKKENVPV